MAWNGSLVRAVRRIGARLFAPFRVLIHSLSGKETGLHIADSTRLAVQANPRISRNRVFKDLATRGRSTMGWIFGVKLHVVMNHKGALMAITITPGDTDDRRPPGNRVAGPEGKLLADKGDISKTPSHGSGKGPASNHRQSREHKEPPDANIRQSAVRRTGSR